VAADLDRFLDGVEEPRRYELGRIPVGGVLEDKDELVAAQAGHGVARSDDPCASISDRNEDLLAEIVSKRIVLRLEVIDVDEHDAGLGSLDAMPTRARVDP
jgi:hypothetical protein